MVGIFMKANGLQLVPFLFAVLATAWFLAACSNEESVNDPLADGPVAAQVTAGIGQSMTRVSVNGQSAAFTAGDVIHVVAEGTSAYDYTLQDGGSWSAGSNPYYFQDRDSVDFQAWYADPALTPAGNEIDIDTKTQANSSNGWNHWDILLTPAVTTTVENPVINFTGGNAFSHIMSQVSFVFQAGNGISDLSALTGYTVKDVTTDATFNTQTCDLTAGSTTGDIAMTVTGEADKQVDCTPIIMVPQTVSGTSVSGTLNLEVTYNGQTYKAALNPPTSGLQAGYSYTYTVTISNTGLEVGNATINDWLTDDSFNDSGDATLQ